MGTQISVAVFSFGGGGFKIGIYFILANCLNLHMEYCRNSK
jgi:hypothetical protein